MRAWQAILAAVVLAAPAHAQTRLIDGDTLVVNGKTIRLFGIDAPETKQTCPDGWHAGRLATTHMQALTTGKPIICQDRDRDRYGRTVAVCRANGEDLGALMVRQGYAWAFTRYSTAYASQEAAAKAEGLGIHAHNCQPAWGWRAKERSGT